MFELRKSKK